jgi:hypothetical protein
LNDPIYIKKVVDGENTTPPHLVHLLLGQFFIYDLFNGASSAGHIASDGGIINEYIWKSVWKEATVT